MIKDNRVTTKPTINNIRPNRATPTTKINSGGARRDRTADLYNAIVALSQLSYGPEPRDAHFAVSRGSCQENFLVFTNDFTRQYLIAYKSGSLSPRLTI